jgi:hypothetical protein
MAFLYYAGVEFFRCSEFDRLVQNNTETPAPI